MPRPQIVVRRVDADLEQQLIDLWVTNRVEGGSSPEATARIATDGSLPASLARPEVTAFVALSDGTAVGYLILSDTTSGLFVEAPCVAIDQLFVLGEWRRHGVARQLLAAAATHADRVGADQIASNVPSQVRDANRFFARLGFSPTIVRRVTTPTALHRKLAGAGEPRYSLESLEQVLHRRRTARGRAVRQASLGVRGA
ncbi:MAG: GNAT family N-acetyltransferase [Lapillicoccus sp.]